MDAIIGLLVLGGLIVLIIFLVRYAKKLNNRKIEWYTQWGLRLNMEHSLVKYAFAKLNVLSGQIDGHHAEIFERMVGSGKNKSIHTFISFSPNPFDFEFRISKEGFFSKIGKSLGASDIEFGDEDFDKTFKLKSKEEARFRDLLDFRAQQALKEIEKELIMSIASTKSEFTYSIMGPFTKEEKIKDFEKVMDFMRILLKNKR